jgi:hypothetical protein
MMFEEYVRRIRVYFDLLASVLTSSDGRVSPSSSSHWMRELQPTAALSLPL